jgi:hypothetical protein
MRTIQPDLLSFIDERLKDNEAARLAITEKDARSLFIHAAKSCIGQTEKGGNNQGEFVELLQKTVDNRASGEAWCMAFVQSMIAYAEQKTGISSPVFSSEHCMTVWRKTPADSRVKIRPLPGAIIIWQKETSDSGHTGIVLEILENDRMSSIEGNTGKNFRDGDGIYQKTRSMVKDGLMKVVGFLKPF